MSISKLQKKKNLELTQLALLSAILVVLQILSASLVRVGLVAPTLALVPMVLAGATLGIKGGVTLGAVFGAVTFICGITGLDAYTFYLFDNKPLETTLLCFLKGILAGLIGALAFKGSMKIFKSNVLPSALVSGMVIPVINTFTYLLGMALFMRDLVTDANNSPVYSSNDALITVMIGFAGMVLFNFILELIVTTVCSPAVATVLSKSKKFKKLFSK
ncbi:MAG: ECF transporter S component [Ruminococcaceae bacterium]|nr:ECF transporter S component [Oscillospiraceae bacterium]